MKTVETKLYPKYRLVDCIIYFQLFDMFDKTVTIIGAGPGGLTLARLLQMRGVTVRLFEHDASFSARDQGGTFDLHDDGGQKALKEAELFDEFEKLARPEGQSTKIIDKYGEIIYEDVGRPDDMSRPEIDRQSLRNILLNSLEPDTVIWNKHVTSVDSVGNGQHKIIFKDGTSEMADFLVGADGTWTKVRPLLSSVQPLYTGVTFVETRFTKPNVTAPQIGQLVGHGSAYVLGDNKGIIGQRNGDESIRVYAALRVPENWTTVHDFNKPNEVRAMLLKMFAGWHSDMLDMLNRSDDYYVARQIYSLPIGEGWTTKTGVTVIGDAAHVMTPFAGEGANLAMLDALELANCITAVSSTNLTSLTEGVTTFENVMLNRARKFSEESLNNQNAFIAEDAPRRVVEIFNSHHGPE